MELDEFAERTATTDLTDDLDRGLQIILHGLAGEPGSVVSGAKKWFEAGNPPAGPAGRMQEEPGDLLSCVAVEQDSPVANERFSWPREGLIEAADRSTRQ